MKKKEIYIKISIIVILISLISVFTYQDLKENSQKENDVAFILNTTTTKPKEIVWDNLTLEELTDKLNKNLYSTLSDTGLYFANFTKETGMDPYLAVSIVNLETGCKWGCSTLVKKCNNIGGLKGKPSCGSGPYMKYDTLEEGINGYLNIVYKNYWLKGLRTAEEMNRKYAESKTWAEKVNKYYETIKES